MIFPKVTKSLKEFYRLEDMKPRPLWKVYGRHGFCGLESIWMFSSSPITLAHELGHFIINKLHYKAMGFNTASVVLFCDVLNDLWDFINGILRYKIWRRQVHAALDMYLKRSISDWLDWILRRDVGV